MIGLHIDASPKLFMAQIAKFNIIMDNLSQTGNNCIQIFVTGPQSFKKITINKEYLKTLINNGTSIVIHSAYTSYPWTGNPDSINNLVYELEICAEIGAIGVVVHLGKPANMPSVKDILDKIESKLSDFAMENSTLYFEINAAKSSPTTFETPTKLNNFFASIYDTALSVGLCIDTAHLWACGVSFTTRATVAEWFNGLMFKNMPIIIHLNDNTRALGAGSDNHAPIGTNIWKSDKSGLKELMRIARENKYPVILERKFDDIEAELIKLL